MKTTCFCKKIHCYMWCLQENQRFHIFAHWCAAPIANSHIKIHFVEHGFCHWISCIIRLKCPPSVANTMLGICYTCEALCCSAHGCCAVECGVACCAAQHTAIATLTLPRTRLVAHQSTGQLQPNTLKNSLTLGGLG